VIASHCIERAVYGMVRMPATAAHVERLGRAAQRTMHFESWRSQMSGGNWKEMFNAACDGDLSLVEYHVKAGVDVNYAHPEFLSTPLVAAILAKQEAIALYLLASGANPNLVSEFDGLTPIQAAQQSALPLVEAKLVELGAVAPELQSEPKGWLSRLFASR
jgi:uncharacterized protein